jgi:hypothetical protein
VISKSFEKYDTKYPTSMSWIYCRAFGIDMYLRRPRLYKYDDTPPNEKNITIHTTPKSFDVTRQSPISNKILAHIGKTYKDYTIIQIGGPKDVKITGPNVVDKTGLDWWTTAETIAKSSIFIGINSGHIQLANCFPRTKKKIIFSAGNYLETFIPQNRFYYGDWIDFNWDYFNTSEQDIGISMSYLYI